MLWIFRFFSVWPLAALHALGAALGWLVWVCSPAYRAQFRANVAQAGLAFETARPAIADAGRFVAELPRLWLRPQNESCLGDVRLQGQSYAEEALAEGKGVIFFAAHCGCFEIEPQALAELYGPVTAIYRPARQAWLAKLERLSRDRPKLNVVPANLSGIRQMLKALRAKQSIAMLCDQVPPEGQGMWAPFFGKPAYTMTLAARLALQSGAAMLPVSCERLANGKGYALTIWPRVAGLDMIVKDDLPAAVALINQATETLILRLPGQYLWGYGRYKTPRKDAV
ncbi:MAG: lysophospholipid acyltransferase family protein [Pseudomonadota bacterium]